MRISLSRLSKSYGPLRAVREVSLDLAPGRIYGLLGENGAGKSTLMRLLAGYTRPDSGELRVNGEPCRFDGPGAAQAKGIGMLHQDPLDFPNLKVWENFSLGSALSGQARSEEQLSGLCREFGFKLAARSRVEDLSLGERQQLELLRLINLGSQLLILDEPSSGISISQKDKLFRLLRELCGKSGRSVILVTHKLAEALANCDEILLMREGCLLGRVLPPYDGQEILKSIFAGTGLARTKRVEPEAAQPELLRLRKARIRAENFALEVADLRVNQGEIIGLAGLEGNGQDLLLGALAGLTGLGGGDLSFLGQDLSCGRSSEFRGRGICYVPAARLEKGLFPELSLLRHLALAFPALKSGYEELFASRCAGRFKVKALPQNLPAELSGGNQQRFLLSLLPDAPRLVLLEHPTRGLDQESAGLVWERLREMAGAGTAIVFSSSDLDEIIEYSSRILVFHARSLASSCENKDLDPARLGAIMVGQSEAGPDEA